MFRVKLRHAQRRHLFREISQSQRARTCRLDARDVSSSQAVTHAFAWRDEQQSLQPFGPRIWQGSRSRRPLRSCGPSAIKDRRILRATVAVERGLCDARHVSGQLCRIERLFRIKKSVKSHHRHALLRSQMLRHCILPHRPAAVSGTKDQDRARRAAFRRIVIPHRLRDVRQLHLLRLRFRRRRHWMMAGRQPCHSQQQRRACMYH